MINTDNTGTDYERVKVPFQIKHIRFAVLTEVSLAPLTGQEEGVQL